MPVCSIDAGTNFSAVAGLANGHQLNSKRMAMSARHLHNQDGDNDDNCCYLREPVKNVLADFAR